MPQEVKQDRMRENTKRVADQKYKNANVIKKKKKTSLHSYFLSDLL